MPDIFDELLDELTNLGEFGVTAAAVELGKKAAEADDPIAQFIISTASKAVADLGIDGLALAKAQFEDLLKGNTIDPTKLRTLPPVERGLLIAAAQRKEINARVLGQAAFTKLGEFFAGLIKGAVGSLV